MKLTFKTANGKKTTFDKSSTHISTLDFGRWLPSQILPVRRGDNVHVRLNQFVRLAPLAVPTYGNIKLITRSYYVPYRLLTPNWYDFVQNDSALTDLSNHMPWCTNGDLYNILLQNSKAASGTAVDFADESGAPRILTVKGRLLYQMFLSLGYGINFTTTDNTEFDLLPLLSVLRVMYDIEYPTRYVSKLSWNQIFNLDKYDHGTDWEIIVDMIDTLTSTFYESDFFINSWDNFNSPNARNPIQYNNNSFSIGLPTSPNETVQVVSDHPTYHTSSTNEGKAFFSSYGHKLLDSLSDFVLRNNIAGRRYLDFIRAHFGYTTSPEQDQFTKFLGSYISNVNIMDVTSNVSNNDTTMGEQAGKGYISGDGKLNYDVQEDGVILFLTKLVPSYGYVQGRKPWTIRKMNFFSLYNPEFDGLGNEAVRNDALFADYKSKTNYDAGQTYGGKPNGVFGFAPRYTFGYKIGHDYLTGDFRLGSRNIGMDSFHTFRVLNMPSSSTPLANHLSFRQIGNEYDRMFSQSFSGSGASYDHFVCYFEFDIKVSSEMKSYSESLPFYEDEGRTVTQTAQ